MCVYVCVCVFERESVCVCVCLRERVCVFVCVVCDLLIFCPQILSLSTSAWSISLMIREPPFCPVCRSPVF